MAEAAEGPEDVDATDCGRAVEIPAVGSALDIGQRYLTGLFLSAPFAAGPVPFEFVEEAEIVDEFDDSEEREDDEFERCAVFRGINSRETSSALIL
jgi:hypothetical protein